MRPRTLIGLMFCTLFLSAPAFAQNAQPVIQTAQAAQIDVTIPEGTTQEFDAVQGEIKFDGTLTNKGTIIIKSSNPAQAEAILRAAKVVNEGKIISQVTSLTIYTEKVYGAGEVTAPENIAIAAADKDLLIANGTYRAKYFRPSAERKLSINARRIDAQVDLKAYELSIGVREGNLDIIKQKVDGDPIYYNRGGDITAVMPGNGFDIYVLAAGNVNLSGVNAIGLNGEVRDFVAYAGLHFANPVDDGNSEFACGGFAGVSCAQTIENNSGPGQIFEGAPGGPFPPSGTITINGVVAKDIYMSARDIVINGTLDARQDTRPGGPSILLEAANSITVTAPLKTEATTVQVNEGFVYLQAPTINVTSKITSDFVGLAAFENSIASTGSITTAAIEARTYIDINGGHIQFGEAGGALAGGAALPLSQPHDSGEFTIKTGKLTAHRFINLAATGNIDAGNIELLTNEAEVPLGTHDVRIHANVGKEDAPPLKIGGGTNGAASITVQGTTDLGPGLTQKTGAIFLTNGPSGDIVIDGAKLHVTSEHDGTPSLIAYAGTGQVTVKGDIVLDGTSSAPAGQILLVGDEIRSTGATISLKDTLAAVAENPAKVVLATSKLTLAGNLTIEANSKAQTSVKVVPKGSITLDPQDNFPGIYVYVDKFPINVTTDEVLVAGAGNLTLKAKSDEAKVEITAMPLKFNNGTSEIFATGDGSQINIDYPGAASGVNSLIFAAQTISLFTDNPNGTAGDINILADGIKGNEGTVLNLLAGGGAGGNGGNIVISAEKAKLGDSATVIDASALGSSGNGGNITITTNSNSMLDLNNAQLKANSGSASGDGGNIVLTAKDIGIVGIQIEATAMDTGTGGEIDLNLTGNGALDLSQVLAIEARGGENGFGGTFSVTDMVPMDDPEAKINVYAEAPSIPVIVRTVNPHAGPTGTGGVRKVTKHGITCQFYKVTPTTSWPKGYWNCAHPGGETTEDKAAIEVALTLQDKTTLAPVNIYMWRNLNDFKKFTGRTVKDPKEAGHSYTVGSNAYVNVFQHTPAYPNLNRTQLKETAGHEFGHVTDYLKNHSGNADFGNYTVHDFQVLDYDLLGVSATASHLRDPCQTSPHDGLSGPLVGVNDQIDGQPFCTGGVVSPRWQDPTNGNSPYRISYILRTSAAYFYTNPDELFAQQFSYEAYVKTLANRADYFIYAVDGVNKNNWFQCTRSWAAAAVNGTAVPPGTAGCLTIAPWYPAKLGHKSSHD